ncbi:MAG: hypothetical protein ABI222_01975 [Opitutaceae bacterium]
MKIANSCAPPLQLVLAYDGLAAACRATEFIEAKRQTEFDERTVSVSSWSFEMLESPALFAQAAGNARYAQVLAIAVCEATRPLSEVAERWLKMCLARRHKAHLIVAAIFEGDDLLPSAVKPWFESFQRVVVGAGCVFQAWQTTGTAEFLL